MTSSKTMDLFIRSNFKKYAEKFRDESQISIEALRLAVMDDAISEINSVIDEWHHMLSIYAACRRIVEEPSE